MVEADYSKPGRMNALEAGDDADFGKTLFPPIGSRSSRRTDAPPGPQEIDKFQRAMHKVMADRATNPEAPGDENASGHIIARRENQVAAKHGISKVNQSVVEKFHAAKHNTAIMSAMGHPELDKLVAREEEEKRKRRARIRELSVLRCSMTGRNLHNRNTLDGEAAAPGPLSPQASSPDLPNVYAALGQSVPATRAASAAGPATLPLAQPQSQSQQHQVSQQQLQPQHNSARTAAGARAVGGTGRDGLPQTTGAAGGQSRAVPGTLRPLGLNTGGGSADWEGLSHSKGSGPLAARRAPQGGKWRKRSQGSGARGGGHSSEPVVRAASRVGRILAEFGGQDDWCSVTVMRHSLATILQANIRGWLVRRKWLANPQAVVDATKAALEAELLRKERRAAMKAELERRAMTRKQKEKAANVLQMLFPQKTMVGAAVASVMRRGSSGDNVQQGATNPMARAKWGRLNKNLDLITEHEDRFDCGDSLEGSDSDMSDLGVEDMAMVKMRARTPPWQKAEQSQWEGQWAKLNTKAVRGKLDVVWDLADTASRVQAVQQRRTERVSRSRAGSRASRSKRGSSSTGTGSCDGSVSGGQLQPYDPATQPLPASVVTELLVHRYIDKYSRLGLLDHLPLRTAAEAAMQQQQQQLLLLQEQQQQQLLRQQYQQQYQQQQQAAAAGTAAGAVAGS